MLKPLTTDQILSLTDDDDVVDLDDRFSARLRIEPDEAHTVFDEDPEVFGKLEWVDSPHGPRPHGFDGRSRKIHTSWQALWWQPPSDLPDEYLGSTAEKILDLVTYGYKGVILELRESITDAFGNSHLVVVNETSLWGIDTLDDGYITDVVEDLAHELIPATSELVG